MIGFAIVFGLYGLVTAIRRGEFLAAFACTLAIVIAAATLIMESLP